MKTLKCREINAFWRVCPLCPSLHYFFFQHLKNRLRMRHSIRPAPFSPFPSYLSVQPLCLLRWGRRLFPSSILSYGWERSFTGIENGGEKKMLRKSIRRLLIWNGKLSFMTTRLMRVSIFFVSGLLLDFRTAARYFPELFGINIYINIYTHL